MSSWSDNYYKVWSKDVQVKKNICDVISNDFDKTGCCSSKRYREFEERVREYLLCSKWKVIEDFASAESDSFGPIVRLAKYRDPNGIITELCHG